MDNKENITIFPDNYYHIKKINGKYFLYDEDIELFCIRKFYKLNELLAEMEENESLEILERFETIDGKQYLYAVDKEDFNADYLVDITMEDL